MQVRSAVRHLPGRTAAWLLVGAIVALSAWLMALMPRSAQVAHGSIELPWWALVIAFALVESWVVHLHFRSETGSFSLFEVPLVLGLIFASPLALWASAIIGTSFALAVVRRQTVIKVIFNVANLSLHAGIASLIVQDFMGGDPLAPASWVVLAAATMFGGGVQIMTLCSVIIVTEGTVRRAQLLSMLATGAVISAANTALALVAALLLDVEPFSLLLLSVPVAVVLIAYRSYVTERNQREQVEFLYASTKALRENPETTAAAASLLDEAASMFRAERASLYLFHYAEDGEQRQTSTCFRHENGTTVAHSIENSDVDLDALASCGAAPMLVGSQPAHAELTAYLAAEGIHDALVGTLHGSRREIGVLMIANRLGQVASFTADDLRLFGTLVEQAAVGLENDQLEQALGEMRLLERKLAHQANHDGLTGLANRAVFTAALSDACADGQSVSVLYIDLDDFKVINDSLGHAAGDQVLMEVAQRLLAVVRPTDIVARLGGDEFAVLLMSSEQADHVARRIIHSLHEPILFGQHDVQIGASVGLARAAQNTGDPALLLNDADVAMYAAKSKGKGAVVEFEPAMRERVSQQRLIRTQLRRAIDDDQFEVVYQPIIDSHTGRAVGAEALVRWNSDDGQRMPDVFIREAERSGLIVSIDRNVLSKVVRALAELPDAQPGFVSVNLSARNFLENDLPAHFATTLMTAGVRPERLVVEITETALIRDPDRTIEQLTELRELGIRIALDDFGTGYSSLSYLRRLPVDLLKLAQPFVADLESDETFVRTMVDLGKNLGLTIIAEGVENDAQHAILKGLGCDYLQGYLFARPLSRDALVAWYERMDAAHAIGDGAR